MKLLTNLRDNMVLADSRVIAEGFLTTNKSILNLIRSHIDGLKKFGRVTFEKAPSVSGQTQSVVYLNEQQTMLLLTYAKSNPKTDEFREKLVNDFYKMKSYLESQSKTLKSKSTKARNMLTDEWQNHGITNGKEFAYLTLEEYKSLQFDKDKRKKDFDDGEIKTLMALEAMEMLSLHYNPVEGFIECKESLNKTAKKVLDVKKEPLPRC